VIMANLDDIDKAILNRIQSNFPIAERPYLLLADEFGITENEIITRVRRMKEDGIIRRIGGNFAPEKLGFVSTLCAGRVPPDKLEHFTRTVNSFAGVTHNYLRKNTYNIWFTIIAPSRKCINGNLSEIEEKSGIKGILNLPATAVYKIRAHFKL